MKNFVITLPQVPKQNIVNGIRIKCRTGEEYRNIVKGQTVYEIPAICEPVKAFVNSETVLLEANDEQE